MAAEWMGWENVFHCEWNEFGQKILKHYWPNAKSYGDITKTDFTIWRGKIDIITGGFPCQPYSQAGKRKGKADYRHLWPEMLRAIREIQPGWVVGENVSGLLNWSGGMVLDEIKADLEAAGFEVLPPCVLPASSKGADHQRDRLWIVANSTGQGLQMLSERYTKPDQDGRRKETSNTFNAYPSVGRLFRRGEYKNIQRKNGVPLELVDISFSKLRKEGIKSMGNAIVPQVAYEIFKAIEMCENTSNTLNQKSK